MDIRALVESAKAKGLSFYLEGDRIKIQAPSEPDKETIALLEELRRHREEVKSILAAPRCWNCDQPMSETTDIYSRPQWACWACARWV